MHTRTIVIVGTITTVISVLVKIIGQGAGMVTMGIIAWQIYIYRDNST